MAIQSEILTVLAEHTEDVRAVSAYPGGGILTGSRDLTTRLYFPLEPANPLSDYGCHRIYKGPEGFVSSVCYGKTKSGTIEIYVGSHDKKIYVYTVENSEPIAVLEKHTEPVSALAYRTCNDQDTLISGGWDSTAVIWRDRKPELVLYGHVHAVWSVAFVARSHLLTAGADKTIRRWDLASGEFVNMYQSHTDCVRDLAVISTQQFLSCSNDQSIVLWSITGEVLQTFSGHQNYIYSICIVREPLKPNQEPPKSRPYTFVTAGEDKTVRIWSREKGCLQVIPLQATSLWSCAALENGNFVVGTSDGHAYVFTGIFS